MFLVVATLAIIDRVNGAGYGDTPSGFQATPWQLSHATFYGDESASATMGAFTQSINYFDLYYVLYINSENSLKNITLF